MYLFRKSKSISILVLILHNPVSLNASSHYNTVFERRRFGQGVSLNASKSCLRRRFGGIALNHLYLTAFYKIASDCMHLWAPFLKQPEIGRDFEVILINAS